MYDDSPTLDEMIVLNDLLELCSLTMEQMAIVVRKAVAANLDVHSELSAITHLSSQVVQTGKALRRLHAA